MQKIRRLSQKLECSQEKLSGGGRGAESWWGCSDSDSDSDSGLLVGSDSDSGSDRKCKIDYILVVERVFAAQAKKVT